MMTLGPSMPSLITGHQDLDTVSCLDIGKGKSSEMLKLSTAIHISKMYEFMPLAWHWKYYANTALGQILP